MEKKCTKCGVVKPLEDFSLSKGKKYGRDPRCRECRKKYQNEKREHITAYHKKYYQEHKGNIVERIKQYVEQNREKVLEGHRRYYREHRGPLTRTKQPIDPMKIKARHKVNHAVEYGKLAHPAKFICSVCHTKQASQYHHHKGYSQENWLEVIPVCPKCHKAIETAH